MPKVQRARTKLHSHAVGSGLGDGPSSWQHVGGIGTKRAATTNGAAASSLAKEDELEVTEDDVAGLAEAITRSAGETEAQKRAAVADALKELIAMGSGSDDDDDEEEEDEDEDDDALDAEDEDGMDDDDQDDDADMDGRVPSKGQLSVKPKRALAAASAAPSSTASFAAASSASKLVFAPSAPQRSANPAADALAAAAVPGGKIKASKADKRAERHAKLMSRLSLPGTLVSQAVRGKRGMAKNGNPGAFNTLRLQMNNALTPSSAALLTPSQQNALAVLKRQQAAAGSDKNDVLFLTDAGDQERMRALQAQVAARHVTVPRPKAGSSAAATGTAAATAASSVAAAAASPAASAASATPSSAASSAATPSPFIAPKVLKASAKRKQHRSELAQFTAVLHHPQFQAQPLAALQTHLANTSALAKLQEQAAGLEEPSQHQQPGARKNLSGSQKKKNKKAQEHRQQILQNQRMQQ